MERISRLRGSFEEGILKSEDFKPRYEELVAEREQLRQRMQEKDSSATVRLAMKEAIGVCSEPTLTAEQARRLMLAFVQKVEAPVDIDPKRAGLPKAVKCRGAWVTLSMPLLDGTSRVLAPMYDARFKGKRLLLDRE